MSSSGTRRRERARAPTLRILWPVSGRVLDVSGLGIGIESDKGLGVGRDYEILLRNGLQVRRLHGQVRWCSLRTAPSLDPLSSKLRYRAGIAIEDLEPRAWNFLSASVAGSDSRPE